MRPPDHGLVQLREVEQAMNYRIDAPDNVQKRVTVLYGPQGQPLVVKDRRPVGFRPPEQRTDDRMAQATPDYIRPR